MSFLDTDNGRKLFNQYLKKVNAGSQRVYRSEIQQFFDFLVETHSNASLQGIPEDVLHAYQEKLSGKHSPKTTKRKFSILNGFFKHVERENRKFHNPIVFKELSLIFPKKDKGYYTVLTVSEASRLLGQCDKKTDIGRRDHAIIVMMLVYGLRANEIAGVRHKHLEHERVKGQQKLWIVDRKGRFQNRPKTGIILNGKALQAFDAWLDIVKGYGIKITGDLPIFLPFIYDRVDRKLVIRRDRLPAALSVKSVENIVTRYIKRARTKGMARC